MIVMQCSRCGHHIEVSDSLRGREIRCARCGNPLAMRSAASSSATEIGVPLLLAPSAESQVATNHAGEEETLTPKAVGCVLSFPFLSPAKGPNELGWLAHYRILRLLGQGGMGIVFEAVDTHLQRPVALKVIKPEFALDHAARERFLREARAMAAVRSDYIVTVHEVGQEKDVPFLAMEFLQGEPLDEWMKRRGRLDVAEIVRLAVQIARGLAAAHQRGLIHRDIKPGNIFLESGEAGPAPLAAEPPAEAGFSLANEPAQPEREDLADRRTMVRPRSQLLGLPGDLRVKILDFGLARISRERSHLTDPGLLMGTPGYMAPEQIEGKAVDARCDLFSLGCLMYELSTGEPPFSAASPMATLVAVLSQNPKPVRELNPGLPLALRTLIEQLMAKNPKDRPATALEVVAALDAITATATAAPVAAAPLSPGGWRTIGVIALAVVLAAAALAWRLLRD